MGRPESLARCLLCLCIPICDRAVFSKFPEAVEVKWGLKRSGFKYSIQFHYLLLLLVLATENHLQIW